MFERPHHQRIALVLESLDADLLAGHDCLFGGGTAIALAHGEDRESVDIDFMVSYVGGYRDLRQLMTGPLGALSIARAHPRFEEVREVRGDQYGIRTVLDVDGSRGQSRSKSQSKSSGRGSASAIRVVNSGWPSVGHRRP